MFVIPTFWERYVLPKHLVRLDTCTPGVPSKKFLLSKKKKEGFFFVGGLSRHNGFVKLWRGGGGQVRQSASVGTGRKLNDVKSQLDGVSLKNVLDKVKDLSGKYSTEQAFSATDLFSATDAFFLHPQMRRQVPEHECVKSQQGLLVASTSALCNGSGAQKVDTVMSSSINDIYCEGYKLWGVDTQDRPCCGTVETDKKH